jgi:hypothetical protein
MLIVLMLNPIVAHKHFQVKSVVGGHLELYISRFMIVFCLMLHDQ